MRRGAWKRLSACAALGLATTLLSAWFGPGLLNGVIPFHWRNGLVQSARGPLEVRWSTTWVADIVQVEPVGRAGVFYTTPLALPAWAPLPEPWEGLARLDSHASGFPLRAMACRMGLQHPPGRGFYDIAWVRGGAYMDSIPQRFALIPLTPIWSGLTADTAV